MFPIQDPQFMLDIHHNRAGELRREADAYRLARAASPGGRRKRFGRASRRTTAVRAPALP